MSMTQRYAGMIRRHAAEWDKQGMPVQAEAARQAARHMEEVQNRLNLNLDLFEAECRDGDELLRLLDLEPDEYRTEGGRLNLPKIRAVLAERKTHNVGAKATAEARSAGVGRP